MANSKKTYTDDESQSRPVRFTAEENADLKAASDQLGLSVSEVIRLCVKAVRPGSLSVKYRKPEIFLREGMVQAAQREEARRARAGKGKPPEPEPAEDMPGATGPPPATPEPYDPANVPETPQERSNDHERANA